MTLNHGFLHYLSNGSERVLTPASVEGDQALVLLSSELCLIGLPSVVAHAPFHLLTLIEFEIYLLAIILFDHAFLSIFG